MTEMDRRCGMSIPMMMALVFVAIIGFAEAQIIPPCAQEISPCLDYRNSTDPPKSCCDPIKDLVATQLTCFCKFLLTPGILEAFGLNITQAIQFGHYCGVTVSINICQASISAPPPSPVQPAATPGGDEGCAGRVAFTGFSFILLLWGYVLFC